MATTFNSIYEIALNGEGVPSTTSSPLSKLSGNIGATKLSISDVLLPAASYTGSITLQRNLSMGYLMSFTDAYLGLYQIDSVADTLLDFPSSTSTFDIDLPGDSVSEQDARRYSNSITEFIRVEGQRFADSNQDIENYDKRKLRTYNNFSKTATNGGMRNLGISFDPSVMYVMGITNEGYTHGGSSSGFMLGETFGNATGPSGLVVGIMDFTAITAGTSIGGLSGSITGGVYALFMSEVGPTSGAGYTQFIVGSTGGGSSFGGTGSISWIYDINSLYVQKAKNSITKTINTIIPNVPVGMTVGSITAGHQIRVYDQNEDHIEKVIKGIEEGQERYDLVRGFSAGYTSGYQFSPKAFASYEYSNTLLLAPTTAVGDSASEAQELVFYMTTDLAGKRTTFETHVRSLMVAGSEIDTLYKLSEWGIPETFKRLYEQ